MIEVIIIFIFILIFTVKEYFYHYSNMDYGSTLLGMAQRAALNTRLTNSIEGFNEKLIIVYCSGCKSVESKITTDFFNTLGNNISNVQVSKIDLSRNEDPINLIKGFIHPKYLIKESYYSSNNTPGPTMTTNDYAYNIEPHLAQYFHSHNDPTYGKKGMDGTSQNYRCVGPDFYTNETAQGTTVESRTNQIEYEETDEYNIHECDYFLVYKTPTILYEIKDHAYLKFPESFPINSYPCTDEEQEQYQNEIQLFVKKLKYWIYYLKEFSNKLIGLYNLVKIETNSSCQTEALEQITDTVNSKDAHYNVIGKYYEVLCNAYPKSALHVARLELYHQAGKRFYRELDNGNTLINVRDKTDLDYLKVDRTRIPSLTNKLTDTDPNNATIRGNKQRLIEFAKRTLIISFNGYLDFYGDSGGIEFINRYNTNPEEFMLNIKSLVDNSVCSNNSDKLRILQDIFTNKGFPNQNQTWRSFVDPKAGFSNANYGWFLLTFDQPLELDDPNWKVCIKNKRCIPQDCTGMNAENLDLCFSPYPHNYFDNAAFRNTTNPQVKKFQNIIQPCLLEFGFIKSNREDKRLFGCQNYIGDVTEPDPNSNCNSATAESNCRNNLLMDVDTEDCTVETL